MAAFESIPELGLGDVGSHKNMAGDHPALDAVKMSQLLEERGVCATGDLQTEGGLLYVPGYGNHPVGYFKPPIWRADPTGNAVLAAADFGHLSSGTDRGDKGFSSSSSGSELEMYAWNPSAGDMAPIMAEGSTTVVDLERFAAGLSEHPDTEGFDFSHETSIFCVELNMPAGEDHTELGLGMLKNLRLLGTVATRNGWQLLPVSMLPNRVLSVEEVNKHPYIQRVSDFQGWDKVKHFTGASYQVLTEVIEPDDALYALNQYQSLGTLFYAASLNSPFTHGEQKGLSGRYHSRQIGSPSGGVFIKPLPETYQEYNALAAEMLRQGMVPSPARVAGHHRDRLRMDIGPNGTVEVCGLDSAGGDPVKLSALQFGIKAALWKLQYLHHTNQTSQLERWPALFHDTVTVSTLATDHQNHYNVADTGMSATITGADDQDYTAAELWRQLINFIDTPMTDTDYKGLPARVRIELLQAGKPDVSSNNLRVFTRFGQQPLDTKGFYRTGDATLGHWLERRYRDTGSIEECLGNLATAYAAHLSDPRVKKTLQNLYR